MTGGFHLEHFFVIWSTVANEDDFDAYEWLFSKWIEDYCYRHPEGSDYPAMLGELEVGEKCISKIEGTHLVLVYTFLGTIN
ncbi:hypothetical protein COJ85_27885 [Bacillus sp. AFS076308]|uniref:hypothetical protein n=1 Tax=unclassified Bacillus (in: firmicutes) TaxID=185979 RepID=UPI000BF38374|nr:MULTISPECIES: hypothetical protein [unclassified Bacillus (in: firmicutes)]PFN83276.1 hypothetical protein COJ85_27885 [Bacillus sp. AFS076308]PGV49466.1 hypothetical protein COD92_21840 [Bacillus sp. AFS037270]